KTLMRGEQAASNPDKAPVSVVKEIAWSSNAPSHVARLQQPVPMESPIQKVPLATPQFEITSIKPEEPVTQDTQLNGDIAGFSCHGTEGIRRSPVGQLPCIAAQGRCTGRYISLPVLVGFAYDVHPRRVRGVPDWRPPGKPIDTGFQIDAKADDPSMA